jgi:hypothetical protein
MNNTKNKFNINNVLLPAIELLQEEITLSTFNVVLPAIEFFRMFFSHEMESMTY